MAKHPASILLVGNDQNLRLSIALILQRAGYDVTKADSHDSLQALRDTRVYQLLILDLDAAESGQLISRRGGNEYPELPVLILSDQQIAKKEQDNGSPKVKVLVKPVAPEVLLDSVEKIIKKDSQHYSKNPGYADLHAV